MRTRVVLVDDEPMSLGTLEDMLEEFADRIEVVGCAGSIAHAVRLIDQKEPDLVFLDIYLPDGDGFEVMKQCKFQNFKVIFTTAYDQYAIQAFSVAALHYLLKPIHPDSLQEAMERYWQSQPAVSQNPMNAHLVIHSQDDLRLIPMTDIVYCEADASYTVFYLKDKTRVVASKPLGVYERQLPSQHFCRIHYKYVVNMSYIARYLKGKGGQVELTTGHCIDVSVRKKQPFLQQLDVYLAANKA